LCSPNQGDHNAQSGRSQCPIRPITMPNQADRRGESCDRPNQGDHKDYQGDHKDYQGDHKDRPY